MVSATASGFDPRVHWSVQVTMLGSGTPDAEAGITLCSLNPWDSLRTASIGKLFLLGEVMRRHEAGNLSLDEELSRDREAPDDYMEDSGLLYLLRQRTLAVGDLCTLVGAFSDNYATNLLVEHVELDAVQRFAHTDLGYRGSTLLDKVHETRPQGTWPEAPDDMSHGCAAELCDFMTRLHHGTLVSPAASRQILRWLAADADTSMTSGAFNVDPLAHWPSDAGVRLAHKTGTESDVRCDVGLANGVQSGTTVVWAVLANWDKARYGDMRDAVLADMRAAGERIRRVVETGEATSWNDAGGKNHATNAETDRKEACHGIV